MRAFRLDATERALLDLEDGEVEHLKERAQYGDDEARQRVCQWAAATARNYYYIKLQHGAIRSTEEAETLAADFLIEFEQTLPNLRKAVHWTRSLLPRYLVYTRHRQRRAGRHTVPIDPLVLTDYMNGPAGHSTPVPTRWDDEQWYLLRTTLRTLDKLPEITRQIIRRIFWDESAPTYQDLAIEFGTTEAAIKMRVSRFYRAVRQAA